MKDLHKFLYKHGAIYLQIYLFTQICIQTWRHLPRYICFHKFVYKHGAIYLHIYICLHKCVYKHGAIYLQIDLFTQMCIQTWCHLPTDIFVYTNLYTNMAPHTYKNWHGFYPLLQYRHLMHQSIESPGGGGREMAGRCRAYPV